MPRRVTAAFVPAVAFLGLAVAPSVSTAATLTPDRACYSRIPTKGSQPINLAVSGGFPNARFFAFGVGGKASSSSTAVLDAAGNGAATIANFSTGGIGPSKGRTLTLGVNEYGGGAPNGQTGAVNVKVTNLAIDLSRSPRSAYAKRTWKVSGLAPLTGKRSVYASWYRGNRLVKRVKLGTGNACGYLRVKRSAFPSRAHRSLTLRVHSQKRYTSKLPYLRMNVRVVRRYF